MPSLYPNKGLYQVLGKYDLAIQHQIEGNELSIQTERTDTRRWWLSHHLTKPSSFCDKDHAHARTHEPHVRRTVSALVAQSGC